MEYLMGLELCDEGNGIVYTELQKQRVHSYVKGQAVKSVALTLYKILCYFQKLC
jgi:hypothetical protein